MRPQDKVQIDAICAKYQELLDLIGVQFEKPLDKIYDVDANYDPDSKNGPMGLQFPRDLHKMDIVKQEAVMATIADARLHHMFLLHAITLKTDLERLMKKYRFWNFGTE